MDLTEQEKSIIKTLAHFDVLDYPLTLLEIAKFNGLGLSADDVSEVLNRVPLNKLIFQEQGLYYFNGREEIISSRLKRYRISLLKLQRARRFARLFCYFPWIRAVAVYSSLSLKNSRADGDIDFFFITAANRAWSARFFINSFLKLFRLRPTPGNARDKICASYFVDEKNMDLSAANSDEHFFYAFGGTTFLFLSGSDEIISDFWHANEWIYGILPAWQPDCCGLRNNAHRLALKLQDIKESILSLISEGFFRNLQMKILPLRYHNNNDGKKVSLGEGIIKLHDNDKRGKYNKLFEENFNRMINYE